MPKTIRVGLLLILAALRGKCEEQEAAPERPPNIVFMLADDLGSADLGCFGQRKIRTPNLDRLATEGMRFTQHYAGSAVCAPSRCVLLTGLHPGHSWIRNNKEVRPEGQPPLRDDAVTLAEILRDRGYATGAFGKWGLGYPESEGDPQRQGFGRFFGYNCQRHAHNHFPSYLWEDGCRLEIENPPFEAHQELPTTVDPCLEASYGAYVGREYAPDRIAQEALGFIRENRSRPFFLYFATTVPHLGLQVPEDSLAEYRGLWPDPPYAGENSYLPHFAPRAAYAAMVTRLDRDVGRIVSFVDELGLGERTIFIFTSDNGPLFDRLGGSDSDFFESAGPLRGRKGSLYEGGIRVPLIVRWKGRIAAASISERVTGFEDWLPTLLDLIDAPSAVPSGIDGISFAPTLLGETQEPRPFLYREFAGYGGFQSARIGDWKGIRTNLAPKAGEKPSPPRTELYDLKEDPSERRDVAADHPEIVARIERLMAEQHAPSRLFPLPRIDPKPDSTEQ